MDIENRTNQLYNRNERIAYIYRWLINNGNLSESEKLTSEGEPFSKGQELFINKIIDEYSNLEENVAKYVPETWTWERFNYIEKAVLINAAAEILIAENKKAIVIDESVDYSKIYCGEKATPLINGIIDKIGS